MAPAQCLLRFLFARPRVLRLKQRPLPPLKQPILRSLGQNALYPPHRSEHTPSKRSWFSRCADFSLPPLLPAAQAEDHLLLFLALRKSPSSSAGRQPVFLPDSIGIALTISIWPTAAVAALYFPNGAPWSPLKANGFHPGLPAVSPSLLPFPSCLAHCYFDASSRRSCVCQTLAHWPLCQLLFRGPGGQGLDRFAHGSVLAGDEYMWGLSYSPKGTLDTSPIRLPHTVVQTLVQIQSQLPGLGQRLFVKESQSLSVLARLRSRAFSPLKAVGINCPSILFSLNSSVCSFHFSYVFFEMLQVSEAPVLTALSDPTSALIFHPSLA